MQNASENELLSAYLDEELTSAEQAEVEQLLAASPEARRLLDDLRTLSASLQSLPQQKLGEDLSEQVLRLAERRMLSGDGNRLGVQRKPVQATSEKSPPRATPKHGPEPLRPTIRHRVLTVRNFVYAAVTIAAAVLVMVFAESGKRPQFDRIARVREPSGVGEPKGVAQRTSGEAPTIQAMPEQTEKTAGREAAKSQAAKKDAAADAPTAAQSVERKQSAAEDISFLEQGIMPATEQPLPIKRQAEDVPMAGKAGFGGGTGISKRGQSDDQRPLLKIRRAAGAAPPGAPQPGAAPGPPPAQPAMEGPLLEGPAAQNATPLVKAEAAGGAGAPPPPARPFPANAARPAESGAPPEKSDESEKPNKTGPLGRMAERLNDRKQTAEPGPTVVIRADVPLDALDSQAFTRLLESNGIRVTRTRQGSAEELVYAEGTPAQLEKAIGEMESRPRQFLSITAEELPAAGGRPILGRLLPGLRRLPQAARAENGLAARRDAEGEKDEPAKERNGKFGRLRSEKFRAGEPAAGAAPGPSQPGVPPSPAEAPRGARRFGAARIGDRDGAERQGVAPEQTAKYQALFVLRAVASPPAAARPFEAAPAASPAAR